MSASIQHKELLQKLVEGTISHEEQWMLERLSLDDPFLAEAIEGYYDNNVQLKADNRIVFLNNTKTIRRWPAIAVAASVIVMLSASYFFLMDRPLESEQALSMQQESSGDMQAAEPFVEYKETGIQSGQEEAPNHAVSNSPKSISQQNDVSQADKQKTSAAASNAEAGLVENKSNRKLSKTPIKKEEIFSVSKQSQPGSEGFNTMEAIQTEHNSGIVVDENGEAFSGAEVSWVTGDTSILTDKEGRFNIDMVEKKNLIITSSQGYNSDSAIASPNMSIQLEKAKDLPAAESELREADLSNEELISVYTERLNKIFSVEQLDCNLSDIQANNRIGISIAKNNIIQELRFPDNFSEQCQAKLRIIFENAQLRNVFSGNRKMFFYYEIRI